VRDSDHYRELVFLKTGLVQTRVTHGDPTQSVMRYTSAFHLAPALNSFDTGAGPHGGGRALFVGAGGGIVPQEFAQAYADEQIDVVEVSREILDLAATYFGLHPTDHIHLHHADGSQFIDQCQQRFDTIVVDAFENSDAPPEGVSSAAFFAQAREALCPGGTLCVNCCGRLWGFGSKPVEAIRRNLVEAFGNAHVLMLPIPTEQEQSGRCIPWRRRNVVFLACRDRRLADIDWKAVATHVPSGHRSVVQTSLTASNLA
jgi:spermidine synthase